MFRSQQRKTKILFGLADFALTALAFWTAYRFRQALPLSHVFFLLPDVFLLLGCFCSLAWASAGYWLNVYTRLDAVHPGTILAGSLHQVASSALAMVVFIVFGLQAKVSRPFLAAFILLSWTFLVLFRFAARNSLPHVRRAFGGAFAGQCHVMIAGLGPRAVHLAKNLEGFHEQGLRILGFLAPSPGLPEPDQSGLARTYPVLPIESLRATLAHQPIDEIHFAVESSELPSLEEVFLWCDEEGVCTRLAVDFFPHVNSDVALERIGGTPMLTFTAAPDDEVLLFFKRILDIVLAAAGFIVLSPVFAIVALAVKLTSPGPVIFSQKRCGLNGRVFTFYKFRSMVADAEKRFHEVAHLSKREIATKIPNDPRLTPIGKWLRRFSIDELPQLFNVLRGDMSIVGPRPALPSEVQQYKGWQRRRLRMRPGLTCLWAVEGRDTVDFETWMRMDLQYIDNWSLGLDARIILMTIPEVLSGRGAS
jgi:exopolysaccharide biosynthesis polyprenyl glycosylphosphotransferase